MVSEKYLSKLKRMIDDLKAMTKDLGFGNSGDEYKIIGELFTYKFLSDKVWYEFNHNNPNNDNFDDFVYYAGAEVPEMERDHLVDKLYEKQNRDDFHKIFDKALMDVDKLNADIYSVKTTTKKKLPLFEPLSVYVRNEDKELELAKRAIGILNDYDFDGIYEGGFDFFSHVFEYLIKDYNKDSGQYAEYFTPLFAGQIMADILFNDEPVEQVSVYDPSAGSGTLLLAMADKIGTSNCTIYTQDISQKSTHFLRINLILNKLAHSLNNVVEGNTMVRPEHKIGDELMKFNFIVSNPPFNTDFSNDVETMENDSYDRFFAGIPNIPNAKKKKMPIYLTFLQHIITSLDENNGRAAVVVPTGFTTSTNEIPVNIRKKLIKNNWLKGVIHMPSNIFANTGTSVSIVFIDKNKKDDKVILIEASMLGKKVSFEDGQKTILSPDEKAKIINFFKQRKEEAEFSALVSNADVENNSYMIKAGHYVEIIEEKIDIDIDKRIYELKDLILDGLEEDETQIDLLRNVLSEV